MHNIVKTHTYFLFKSILSLSVLIIKFIKLFANNISMSIYYKVRFFQSSKYLRKGVYLYSFKKKIIFKNDINTILFITENFGMKLQNQSNAFISFRNLLTFCVLCLLPTSNKKKFDGSFVLFSNKTRSEYQFGDLKIIDIYKKEILTSYRTVKSFKKKISENDHFSQFFNLPLLKSFNSRDLTTTEVLIDFKPNKLIVENDYIYIIEYIFNSYINYFRKVVSTRDCTYIIPIQFFTYTNIHESNNYVLNKIQNHIDNELIISNFPSVYQHGDLCFSNILFSNTNCIYIIDWEHASNFSFLYDLMWPWQNEAIHKNNYLFINLYFDGYFDEKLQEVFKLFSLEFRTCYRLSYLLLVVSEIIFHRVLNKIPSQYNHFLKENVYQFVINAIKINEKSNIE